ncbi:hypothetical protein GQ44DRAFT_276423 [Phaeosphaeriaceae sp. PMI808]|nr:hypothetical protein GQ44DRAFT_276423 [Phaeosphaeriaceae sp. PMI808]
MLGSWDREIRNEVEITLDGLARGQHESFGKSRLLILRAEHMFSLRTETATIFIKPLSYVKSGLSLHLSQKKNPPSSRELTDLCDTRSPGSPKVCRKLPRYIGTRDENKLIHTNLYMHPLECNNVLANAGSRWVTEGCGVHKHASTNWFVSHVYPQPQDLNPPFHNHTHSHHA